MKREMKEFGEADWQLFEGAMTPEDGGEPKIVEIKFIGKNKKAASALLLADGSGLTVYFHDENGDDIGCVQARMPFKLAVYLGENFPFDALTLEELTGKFGFTKAY